MRLVIFAALVVAVHLLVIIVRRASQAFLEHRKNSRYQKLKSVVTLLTSVIVFSLYFIAVGFVLREFGVSLAAYLTSATVIGLAIGFGLQGVVQDVVTGLTLIFSDLIDVGDLVEISSQTGIVRAITMRFVQLENALGATVFVPNRTISNITNYPKGYVRCIVDVTLRGSEADKQKIEQCAHTVMRNTQLQFPAIFINAPSIEGRISLEQGKEILRTKFRIWPNRGEPVEKVYMPELTEQIRKIDPDYEPWMNAISYEVEAKKAVVPKRMGWRS